MRGWNKIRAVMMICVALGWWSVWFPEFAVWADAVCVTEDEKEFDNKLQETISLEEARVISRGLANVDREQIQIKSRLLTLLKQQLRERGEK